MVCVGRALKVDFVFGKRAVLTLRACFLALESFAAALVAFVINLWEQS